MASLPRSTGSSGASWNPPGRSVPPRSWRVGCGATRVPGACRPLPCAGTCATCAGRWSRTRSLRGSSGTFPGGVTSSTRKGQRDGAKGLRRNARRGGSRGRFLLFPKGSGGPVRPWRGGHSAPEGAPCGWTGNTVGSWNCPGRESWRWTWGGFWSATCARRIERGRGGSFPSPKERERKGAGRGSTGSSRRRKTWFACPIGLGRGGAQGGGWCRPTGRASSWCAGKRWKDGTGCRCGTPWRSWRRWGGVSPLGEARSWWGGSSRPWGAVWEPLRACGSTSFRGRGFGSVPTGGIFPSCRRRGFFSCLPTSPGCVACVGGSR